MHPGTPHRDTVGEAPHPVEAHPLPLLQGDGHRRRVLRLHAHDPHLRPQGLQHRPHPRDQPAAAHRHEHRVERPRMLPQDLQPDGRLSRDHVGIVVGVDERQPLRRRPLSRAACRSVVVVAEKVDLRPERPHRRHLDRGRRPGHHDHRPTPEPLRRQPHALRVVARRRADHPPRPILGGERRDLVIRPPDLEREHRLLVLPLEPYRPAEPRRQPWHRLDRRLPRDVVHPREQRPLQEIVQRFQEPIVADRVR